MENKMKKRKILRWVAFASLTTAALVIAAGKNSPQFAQGAQAGKGLGADYGARDPRTCKDTKQPIKGAISAAQAQEYVICAREGVATGSLHLVEDLKVEVGKGRPYSTANGPWATDIDTSATVYPIRGSFKNYICQPHHSNPAVPQYDNIGKNCSLYDSPVAEGVCYKTTFGDWKCEMAPEHVDWRNAQRNVAPPGGKTAPTPEVKKTPVDNAQQKTDKPNQTPAELGRPPNPAGTARQDQPEYPQPDTSAMESYFEILKYKYNFDGTLTVVVKTKVEADERPRKGWLINFYDEDGVRVCVEHSFMEENFTLDAGQNETFKTWTCGAEMKRVKKVVITRHRG